ncbi:acyl-ACP--UDP-N-acetylglucosamine O-acyltransferase [Hydromonas duriensis]|uniref:Acyl-[acyl-carrier-protein]--UDP-N-acetylglucosamine O-acyltransferase n=1 Tax=Hydromonas duriensis TaxID=1527608 RepID=A0A4R6Y8G7_9BURK|nr:acyl-ACP--UDP-N-acetylglucosamine O-acyltransferase [Hydromonas duriensis]TDR31678.1 acyl-[acyl-carrier-protein]--UDP-N-acetylglucosamine O-acyltransferase [Hydromonas duriensis]
MAVQIHPTAIVEQGAQLGEDVVIGAYSIIGAQVSIGDRTHVGSHSIIEGITDIGVDNQIGHHVLLGGPPQDKKYAGEPTRLSIGDRNSIREFTSVHRGTVQDKGVTIVGNDNWIMGYVHLAHDCVIGNHTILASNAQLAGHIHVGDWAIMGGLTGSHQFVKVGAHAMVGGGSVLHKDVPPFVMISGNPATPFGVNSEGMRRRGFTQEQIMAVKRAYKAIYRQDLTIEQAIEAITASAQPDTASVLNLMTTFLTQATRGIVR